MSRPLSEHPVVITLAALGGVVMGAFGVNALLRPEHAITFFEIDPPKGNEDFFDLIMPVYGIRNVVLGAGILTAAFHRQTKTLGSLLLGASAIAVVDGLVCYRRGHGQGGHWAYAPQTAILGLLLVGALDGVFGAPSSSGRKTK